MPSDGESKRSTQNEPPYPEARRVYRLLGVIHAPLFGALLFLPAHREGHLLWAIGGGLFAGLATLGVFWRLADDHYRGNVPGEPGALIYKGDEDEF